MLFFVTGGGNVNRALHDSIHRVAVRHGTREAARVAGGSHRHARTNHASRSSALRLGNTNQLNADLGQSTLHNIVAHETCKTARIQTSRHLIRIGALYRAVLRDGAHHDACKTTCVIVVCRADGLARCEVMDRTMRNHGIKVPVRHQSPCVDNITVKQQRNEVAQAKTRDNIEKMG